MNGIVVPLSAAPSGASGDPGWIALSVVAHVALVALPIAYLARRCIAGGAMSAVDGRLSARRPAP